MAFLALGGLLLGFGFLGVLGSYYTNFCILLCFIGIVLSYFCNVCYKRLRFIAFARFRLWASFFKVFAAGS